MHSRALLAALLVALPLMGDVRVKVRVGPGHPIARPNRTVIVRPARPAAVVVRTPAVYAAPVVWTRTVASLPSRDRLLWEDSEVITRREDWVDTTLNVNNRGNALYLNIEGRAHLDFAEVQFDNGQVQVVDFREGQVERGTFLLLDFKNGRSVNSVRLIAKSQSPRARITVYLAK
jgi:hypothetical protein